jgi:hypothetical protein
MSPAKKKSSTAPAARFPKLAALLAGWGKFLLLGLLLAGLFAAAGYKIWQFAREKTLSSEEYQFAPEKILLKPWPMPSWVQPDPRLEVFDQLRRQGAVSMMNEDLSPERVTAAFEQNPWIARVHKVTKKYPATVEVELEYRRPVLMVCIDEKNYANAYAVDADGISLPTKGCFTDQEIAKYPHLIGVDKPPATGVGKRWGDSRVIGGAEIAAALLPVWEKLHLKHIIPKALSPAAAEISESATQSPQFGEYHFDITAQGSPNDIRIPWGRSPSDKNSQEPTPAQKAKKLEKQAQEWGSLEKCPDPDKYLDLTRP